MQCRGVPAAALRGASASCACPRRCRGLTEDVTARAVGQRLWSSGVPPARRQQGRVKTRHDALRVPGYDRVPSLRDDEYGGDVGGDVTARAVGQRLWSSGVPPARRQQGRVKSRHAALRSAYRVMAECRRSATMSADVGGDGGGVTARAVGMAAMQRSKDGECRG